MASETSQSESSGNDLLERLVAKFLSDVEAGRVPDREAILKEHSSVAEELEEFFRNHDRMTLAADSDPAPVIGQETFVPRSAAEQPGPAAGAVLRYFGDYELLEEIARGGMGVVYKARQVQLNRIVAVKMILSGALATTEDVRRFRSEAEAAAGLQHPSIVPVHEVGEFEGQHFYSMGFVDGSSLAAVLRDGPMPQREAAELIRQIAAAVQHAHNDGIIHRDLKPANVLLDGDGKPHVTDFGLARRMTVDQSLTPTGEILGTPSYMPPEQALGRNTEVREVSDVYSLGAILYATLTGRPPFQADNPMDTLLQVIEREPVSPRELNPSVSRDLETICLKCLQKDRSRRYQSAEELAEDLRRYLTGETILARPVSSVGRLWRWSRRNKLAAALSLALSLALISGTAFSSWFAWQASQNEADAVRLAGEKSELAQQAMQLAEDKERLADQESEARENAERQAEATAWNLYVARMFPMEDAWEDQDFGKLETLLVGSTPGPQQLDFRGWEWYFFREQVEAASHLLTGSKLSARFDLCKATGQVAVAGQKDVTIVNVADEHRRRIPLPTTAWTLAWHPAGSQIAFADNKGLLFLLNVADGTVSEPLRGHADRILAIAWTDDGRQLATADFASGLIIVRDAETQSIIRQLPPPNEARSHVSSLDWHPDGVRLAAAYRFNSCGVWNAETGEKLWSDSRGGGTGGPVVWNPDGTQLAVGTSMGVYTRDEQGRRQAFTPTKRVHSIAWHDDGEQIAIGLVDHSVVVWNCVTEEVIRQRIHQFEVDAVHWVDEEHLMSASGISGVRISRVHGAGFDQPLVETTGEFLDVSWHVDGRQLALPPGGKIVEANSGELVKTVEGYADEQPLLASPEISIGFHPTSDRVVAVNKSRASILDASSGGRLAEFSVPQDGTITNRVIWHAEENIIHVVSSDGQYSRWDGDSGNQLDTRKIRDQLWAFDVSPDGKTVATGGGNGFGVEFYDTETKQVTAHAREYGWIRSVAWRPDGASVAAGEHGGRIRLIRSSDGSKIRYLAAHQGPVYAVRFSPDGNRLASGGDDGNLKLWDTNTWQCVLTIPLQRVIHDIEWSRDGRQLALACDHGAHVFTAHSSMPATGYAEDVLKAQRKGIGTTKGVPKVGSQSAELPEQPVIDYAAEAAAATWVLQAQGSLTVDRGWMGPVQVDNLERLPTSPFQVTKIDLLNRSGVVDEDLRCLSALPKLTHLNLRGTSISDDGLPYLADLTRLEMLNLGQTAVKGTGFKHLSRLTRLRSLTIIHVPLTNETFSSLPALPCLSGLIMSIRKPGIDDAALAALVKQESLQVLDLHDAVNISGDGFLHLSRLRHLHTLRFHRAKIADDSIQHLTKCANLKHLELSAVRSLTDSGFEHLKELQTLEELYVPRTRFSDAGLAAVLQLKNLKKLDITETQVSPETIADFRKARPDCEVISGR